jgi:3-oxoacyl-[acyl-carrier protein] reductase
VGSDLKGRHALVCGASKGIGRAAALKLASEGATVTCLARSADRLDALVAEITAAGGTAAALVADLDEREGLAAAVGARIASVGAVHILINNTGGPPGGPLVDAPASALLAALSRHVLAAHELVQACLPGMRQDGYGRIINVLSTSVREPIDNLGVSNTTRGAMAAWAKSLSRELPPGVTINNVLPGFTDTARLTDLKAGIAARRGLTPDQVEAGWLAMVPEGRLAAPSELADAIAWLASPSAGFIRGVSLPVDGGRLRSI